MRILLIALLLLATAAPAFSQPTFTPEEPAGFAKVGGYAGVAGILDFKFDGETFDGMTFYQEIGGDEILILPKLEKSHMFRGILGYRGKKAAIEFSYDRTQLDGTFFDSTGEATFQSINIDGRFFFLRQGRFQPHVLLGGAFPWLTVKEGSFLEDDPDAGVGDGTFKGYGINTEVGLTVYPHPQFAISGGYAYRLIWFDRATGLTETLYELRPRFRETSGGVVITGLFTF